MNKSQNRRMEFAKQINAGKICPYCYAKSEHVADIEIYSKSYGTMIYLCRKCTAYCGSHKSRPTEALGRLANADIRGWKIKAHASFDSLWQRKIAQGHSKPYARGKAYKWLAEQMEVDPEFCHIGMFDVEQCKQVVEICKPYIKTTT